jgi:hypothetical protein
MVNMKNNFKITIITLVFLLSYAVYLPSSSAEPGEDIVLSGSEVLTISGFDSCNNLSISQEATLIVEKANFRINGLIRMSDYARLFIIDSQVELNPPPLNDSTLVVHATDHSMIKITEGSYVEFNPQPTATNISYMLMEDNCDFFVIDSTFRGDLPSIINQSIEIASVTAGVFLLSGYANWYMINSNIIGTVNLDGMELIGRWFWCSLHQRSSLYIENSDLELLSMSSSFTMLKPVSGSVTIKDSRILGGKVDVEVAAQGSFINSIFHGGVRFMDSSMVSVLGCTFVKDAVIGVTLSFGETVGYNPETELEIINSTFEKNLRCDGNSTTTIFGSTMSSLTVKANATASVTNSTISGFTSAKDQSSLWMTNTELDSIRIYDTTYLYLDKSKKISIIYFYGSLGKAKKEGAFFKNTQIEQIVVYSEFSHNMFFENVSLDEFRFYNDITCAIELVKSSLATIFPMRSGDNVTLEFTKVDSITPELEKQKENITIKIFHRLTVLVTLNGLGLETGVQVTDDMQNIWGDITQSGIISYDLHYKTIHNNVESVTEDYGVSTSYLGFTEEREVKLTSSKTVHFDWIDSNPPEISDVQCGPLDWNMGQEITIKIVTSDTGVGSIKSAALFYKIDSGKWNEVEMFKIKENTYEAIIPKSMQTVSISYYIKVADMAGNNVTSQKTQFTIGEEENYIYLIGFIAFIFVISFIIVRFVIMKKKVRKYASKYEFRTGDKKR